MIESRQKAITTTTTTTTLKSKLKQTKKKSKSKSCDSLCSSKKERKWETPDKLTQLSKPVTLRVALVKLPHYNNS